MDIINKFIRYQKDSLLLFSFVIVFVDERGTDNFFYKEVKLSY